MRINSISSIRFGLSYNDKVSELLSRSKDEIINNHKDRTRWDNEKNKMDKIFPDNWTLSTDKKSTAIILIEPTGRVHFVRNLTPICDVFSLTKDLKDIEEFRIPRIQW